MSVATTSLDFDKDALNNLTDEEREAITGSEFSDDEIKAMEKIANANAEDDSQDGDSDIDDDKSDKDESVITTDVSSTSSKTTDEPIAEPDKQIEPSKNLESSAFGYAAKLPDDYEEKIGSLTAQENALNEKFKSGEIDFDQLTLDQHELRKQRDELTVQRAKAEISQEMTEQHAKTAWANTVNRFVESSANVIDYKKDADKFADLDQFVKVLANKQENEDKPMEWFLSEAHKRVMALHGLKNNDEQKVDDAKAIKDAQTRRKPPISDAPANLSQIPGGDGPGDLMGEFADLDALEGDEYEAAIAKLSPAQREKFILGH